MWLGHAAAPIHGPRRDEVAWQWLRRRGAWQVEVLELKQTLDFVLHASRKLLRRILPEARFDQISTHRIPIVTHLEAECSFSGQLFRKDGDIVSLSCSPIEAKTMRFYAMTVSSLVSELTLRAPVAPRIARSSILTPSSPGR